MNKQVRREGGVLETKYIIFRSPTITSCSLFVTCCLLIFRYHPQCWCSCHPQCGYSCHPQFVAIPVIQLLLTPTSLTVCWLVTVLQVLVDVRWKAMSVHCTCSTHPLGRSLLWAVASVATPILSEGMFICWPRRHHSCLTSYWWGVGAVVRHLLTDAYFKNKRNSSLFPFCGSSQNKNHLGSCRQDGCDEWIVSEAEQFFIGEAGTIGQLL